MVLVFVHLNPLLLLCNLQLSKITQLYSPESNVKLVNCKHTLDSRGPLHLASCGNQVEVVRLLLRNGAEVNRSSSGGYTPLHDAAERGHCEGAVTALKKL
jgi:ankyrin repeat protein